MEENKLIPKIELTADLSDTLNEVYKDTAQKPLRSGSKAVTTLMDFFNNTILYPMQKYNLYAENKLNNFAKELQEKASNIPNENLVEPKINILGPAIEGLKYNLDEEHIKEMFINILISDMDNRKQNKVHPSFINIVKELNQDDAKILKRIKELNVLEEPIIRFKYVNSKDNSFVLANNNIFIIASNETFEVSSIVLTNLIRLGLIEIDFTRYRSNIKIYEFIFDALKSNIKPHFDQRLDKISFDKGLINITELGKNLIDICLS